MKAIREIAATWPLLSPWLNIEHKPAFIGVYKIAKVPRRNDDTGGVYAYWDGQRWSDWQFSPEQAYTKRDWPQHEPYFSWRGIAAPY